jgi:hypothetical protein
LNAADCNIAKLPELLRGAWLGDWMTDAALSGVTAVEKRELSKIDFEIIDCNIALIR